FDVVGNDIVAPFNQGEGLRRSIKRKARARAAAQIDVRVGTCSCEQIENIVAERPLNAHLPDRLLELQDIVSVQYRLKSINRFTTGVAVQNLALGSAVRISNAHA